MNLINGNNATNTINPTNKNNLSGFTLAEILIAIFIFAVVITIIYVSYTGTFRIVTETESQAEIFEMAGIAMERILDDLESTYMPEMNRNTDSEENYQESFQFLGKDQEIKDRDADTLQFISRVCLNLSGQDEDTGKTEINYYVKENDKGDDFVLYRRNRPMFEEGFSLIKGSGAERMVLCHGLVSANFTYHQENGKVFESWDSTSDEHKDRIPKIVSIELEFFNPLRSDLPIRFMTSISLPINKES